MYWRPEVLDSRRSMCQAICKLLTASTSPVHELFPCQDLHFVRESHLLTELLQACLEEVRLVRRVSAAGEGVVQYAREINKVLRFEESCSYVAILMCC